MTGPNPIAEALERDWRHLRHPHQRNQTPATMPATMAAPAAAAPKETTTMPLTTIEDDVKADLTDGLSWLGGLVGRLQAAAPGIIATSEAVGGSTVGKLVEALGGAVLPPQVEDFLAGVVKDAVARYSATQAPATGAQPVQTAVPAQ